MLNQMSFSVILLICLAFHDDMFSKSQVIDGILRAEVQSCKGCSLNRLQEVKTFIYDDLPKYPWASFKSIPGASPDLVLFDKNNREVERVSLSPLNRRECNNLMQKYGNKLISKSTIDAKQNAEL